jgi:hypothetical protein
MAGRDIKWKKSAMAVVLQVYEKKRGFLGFFQSARNSLITKPIVAITLWIRL